ncbi:MAG TPA: helix-turn-helix domain-containing protein [Candidatus Binatia bacterium]|nr:helix-turn-helix domain-containing protein [Candidatus Binatia bacterium]
MATLPTPDLFPEAGNPDGTRVINERCLVRTQDGHRVVIVAGMVLAQYAVSDRMSEALAMVSLVEQGWANQIAAARVFDCSVRTVRRHQRRFEEGGLAALGRNEGCPPGHRRLATSRRRWVQHLKSQGYSQREIARRIGVSEKAVRNLLRRLGWKSAPCLQPELPLGSTPTADPNLSASATISVSPPPAAPAQSADPNLSAFSAPAIPSPSADSNPAARRADRLLARLGLLEDAAPLFGSGTALPRAGVLLALPALVAGGVFESAGQIYGSLGPSFYGLRTSLLTLLLMALWRIKRPEALKEHSPVDLGRVLGLDRAPEVKTLRRKLARLAACQKAAELGRALAQRRVALRPAVMGFLYVDGHVRVYHGQHRLPKAHVARMRLSMPATSDYWINDKTGDPLFVVTAQANAGLVKMLPDLLEQVRGLVGKRRVTVVFDRGGYSPKLFQRILAAGFDFLTYRKGRFARIPGKCFRPHRTRQNGRTIHYTLADQEVRLLKGKLRLRQVTRRMDNGHQTPILTSRRDLPAAQVAYHMFERWRQENFFKYLREEYALDALAEHAVEPDDPTREVPNPAWAAADAKLRQAQAHLDRLQAEYGLEALVNLEQERRTMRGFKIAKGKLGRKIWSALQRVMQWEARRSKLPRRVPVQAATDEPVVKLAPERKHLTNILKMVAYQAESDLFRLLAPHYRRVQDEGRTLVQAALAGAADIEVTERALRVTLAPMSSLHKTKAVAALCEELNQTQTLFPGSLLLLRYAIREA